MKQSFQKLYNKIWHKKWVRVSIILILVVFIFTQIPTIVSMIKSTYTVVKIGPKNRDNLKGYYRKAGLNYPGNQVAILIFDEEKIIELWSKSEGKWHLINTYPSEKNTRNMGEGSYKIIGLNSNILYSFSMRLQPAHINQDSSDLCEHPKDFDIFLDKSLTSDRSISVGDDEFSIGCLSISNDVFEELFILAHDIGINNVELIKSPIDMRKKDPEINIPWYRIIKKSLEKFK